MGSIGSGRIPAASTRRAVRSSPKRSIPCTNGTSNRPYALRIFAMSTASTTCSVVNGSNGGELLSRTDISLHGLTIRSWTLQELVAPHRLVFLNRDWNVLADKKELADMLSAITTIPTKVFYGEPVWQYCVAERMRWACGRHTKREEDLAYCLIGIFDIAMPLVSMPDHSI